MTLAVPAAPSSAPAPVAPAIALEGVTYRYAERTALDGVSLTVPRGAIFGLLGPNGSGKSTLLSLLIGRRQPDEGDVRLLGEPVSPALRARVGMVFQEPSLDPLMTVEETMRLQARLFGLPRAAADSEGMRLLASLGLADRLNARTSTLSGGLKRRVELARALLPSPELLLLDEPTLALDPDARQALWHDLTAANASGATLLLATNDVAEAERYCSAVALLDEGRLVALGIPSELKRDLRRDAVRIDWHDDPVGRIAMLMSWEGIGGVRLSGLTTHVTVDTGAPFLTRVFREYGEHIHAVQIEPSTLEDVYFQLVGRGIAPGGPS